MNRHSKAAAHMNYITSSHAQVRQKSHWEGVGGHEVLLIVQEFSAKNKKAFTRGESLFEPW